MGVEAFGNFGLAQQHKANARIAGANARVARAQGRATRGQAYGQAARLELENAVAGDQAAENMARLREGQRKSGATVEAARAASGFTTEGSGNQAQLSVLEQYEQVAQDMVYSRSLEDLSARFNATMQRRAGDIALQSSEAEAVYNEDQIKLHKQYAHNANKSAWVTGTLSAIGAAVGAYFGGAAGAKIGAQAGAGAGSMYSAGQVGSMESQKGSNSQDVGDFAAVLQKGMDKWMDSK